MDRHDAACQWFSAEPQESPSRYQLVSTYQAQCCIAVVAVVSGLALGLELQKTSLIGTVHTDVLL